jgi:hypothetical protein
MVADEAAAVAAPKAQFSASQAQEREKQRSQSGLINGEGKLPVAAIATMKGDRMIAYRILMIVVAATFLAGCENMSPGQKGATTGAVLGSGIGMVAGGSFGQVVGAGLIGGAAGYIGGSAIGNR